jgi:hypothetical protein
LREEFAANEEKLLHANLLRSDMPGHENRALDAEFMPAPGRVPDKKKRPGIWLQQGISLPWGGRFKNTSPRKTNPEVLFFFFILLRKSTFLTYLMLL